MAGLSWDVMLKVTKFEPELVSDARMYLFFEKGVRDGIFKRYNKANDKYFNLMTQNKNQNIYL